MKALTPYLVGIVVLLSASAAAAECHGNSTATVATRVTSSLLLDVSSNRPFAGDNLWPYMTSDREDPTLSLSSADGRRKLEAAFTRDSYRPGEQARLGIWGMPPRVNVQIFRTGPEHERTRGNDEMRGIPVSTESEHPGAQRLTIPIGNWPTGMYFARLRAGSQVAFAPFVLRPRRLGEHRVAVVMPTSTWQAYNFHDDDGDGAADTWYADRRRHVVRVARPHLNHGVPLRFRAYDLPFLHWLAWSHREVDYLAQPDLERSSGRTLRRRYDLIVFPGHHEYVTGGEYDAVTGFRNLGGNLMFLSANNFFWKVERRGNTLHQIGMWRDLGRPEAALVGVQYVTYGSELRGPYVVRNAQAAPWLFRNTGLRNGSSFGTFGIEIDRRASSSPRNTVVLAEIRNGHGSTKAAQMAYYETRRGAKVFAAGAFTLAGSATRPYGDKLLANLWRHMTSG
jgi:hypothetical protein